MRRKCPGLKPAAEAMGLYECVQAVEERRVLAEAVPKGAVDSTGERMLA